MAGHLHFTDPAVLWRPCRTFVSLTVCQSPSATHWFAGWNENARRIEVAASGLAAKPWADANEANGAAAEIHPDDTLEAPACDD